MNDHFVRRGTHIILLIHTFQPPKSLIAVRIGLTSAPIASQTTLISIILISLCFSMLYFHFLSFALLYFTLPSMC